MPEEKWFVSLSFLQRLELVILDYMTKRGFRQSREVFATEILANPVPVGSSQQDWGYKAKFQREALTINSPEGFLQEWWNMFFEAFSSRFPEAAVLATESFEKVAQTVKSIVSNSGPANPSYASNHTGADISNVMASSPIIPPPHLIASFPLMESGSPDLMDAKISDLLSSICELPNLSPPRDMPSSSQFLEMSEMDGMLPFASNSGYPLQQIPTVPPQWNARDGKTGINFGGATQLEPNIRAPANALPPLPGASDAGNYRFFQQSSHQGWPLADALPEVAVQTFDKLHVPAPASSGDFNRVLIQAGSSGKDVGMLGDKNKRTPKNLPVDKQILAPIGGKQMKDSGKQIAVQEQANQLRLQSSNKSGRKRKTSLISLSAVGKEKATTDCIMIGNSDSYLSRGDAGLIAASNSLAALRKSIAASIESDRKGITIKEIGSLHATKSKLLCCHFHSQGKLLATAGHERKVVIWDVEHSDVKCGEGHAHLITDIRFRPNSMVFATSSFDRTVMLWDAAKPSNPFKSLVGHAEHVMSTDFHPTKAGLLSSCDSNDEIRLWDVDEGDCKLIFKGGSRQVRFQPRFGNLLASSTGNVINIFDVETNSIQQKFEGHVRDVRSICWDMSGNFLASVSEDSARIWCVSGGKCLHELCSSGNKFQSCTFHPDRAQLLVIGSHELLELWNPMYQSHRTWPHRAHDDIISSFADSPPTGTIASVSHDQYIKIWQ
ncbi:transcriptional corepressor LEUNIG_HOMOLOG-like isoform X1 [Nicotiana sylvestris]|uniref:transcriptional corepressor LEUNIG_HOMOLOG-like isoform X1 n=1 Tax=Nicotiana sylvestris TaxID=4096 RepID=UPI00388CA9FC